MCYSGKNLLHTNLDYAKHFFLLNIKVLVTSYLCTMRWYSCAFPHLLIHTLIALWNVLIYCCLFPLEWRPWQQEAQCWTSLCSKLLNHIWFPIGARYKLIERQNTRLMCYTAGTLWSRKSKNNSETQGGEKIFFPQTSDRNHPGVLSSDLV